MPPRHYVVLATALVAVCSHVSAIVITNVGTPYTQDFNSLAASGTSAALPTHWTLAESRDGANTTYSAGTGSGTAGDTYSFGLGGDRALGGLQSGNVLPLFGAYFENRTGGLINALEVEYTGEQWRLGATNRADRLDFQFSLDATSLTTGTWSDWDGLDFVAPMAVAGVGARDGNLPANRIAIAAAIAGISLVNDATIWLRWSDFNAAGSDDGLAIDDFSLTAHAPVTAPSQSVPDSLPMAAAFGIVLAGLAAVRRGLPAFASVA
jgi:hypothetical protein